MTDQFTVDRRVYEASRQRRMRSKYALVVHTHRTGAWTPTEDAIVLRDDILLIEKVAILQRRITAVMHRATVLKRPVKTCQQCLMTFHPHTKDSLYCSQKCFGVGKTVHPKRPCQQCGVNLIQGGPQKRFCSKQCATAAQIKNLPRPCQQCGVVFKRRKASKYCSYTCRAKADILYPPRPCLSCGTIYKPKDHTNRGHCSLKCSAVSRQRKSKCCQNCGNNFRPKETSQKYCTRACYLSSHTSSSEKPSRSSL
jgi:hypothetical protein